MDLVLFDFDGTLCNSGEGIRAAFRYVFNKIGYPTISDEEISHIIGPPLKMTFGEIYPMNQAESRKCISLFHEFYNEHGMKSASLYDGIKDCLLRLKNNNYVIGLATSKPEPWAVECLKRFGVFSYFDIISGASMDETLSEKGAIMEIAIKKAKAEYLIDKIYMVGDRYFDIEAAKRLNVIGIGVTYGFGSAEELIQAGATMICNSATEIPNAIMQQK